MEAIAGEGGGQLEDSYEAREASDSSSAEEDEEGGGRGQGELSAWGICGECQCLVCTCEPQDNSAADSGALASERAGGTKRKAKKKKGEESAQGLQASSSSVDGGMVQGAESVEGRRAQDIQRVWRGKVARGKVARVREARVRDAAVCIQAFARGTRERLVRHERANMALQAVDGRVPDAEADLDLNDVLVETAVLQRVRRLLDVKGMRGVTSAAVANTARALGGTRQERAAAVHRIRQRTAVRLLQRVFRARRERRRKWKPAAKNGGVATGPGARGRKGGERGGERQFVVQRERGDAARERKGGGGSSLNWPRGG